MALASKSETKRSNQSRLPCQGFALWYRRDHWLIETRRSWSFSCCRVSPLCDTRICKQKETNQSPALLRAQNWKAICFTPSLPSSLSHSHPGRQAAIVSPYLWRTASIPSLQQRQKETSQSPASTKVDCPLTSVPRACFSIASIISNTSKMLVLHCVSWHITKPMDI